MGFFGGKMQDFYEYYTKEGAYLKSFSFAAAILYCQGWNKTSVSLAAASILITFIRMTFFKKSPQELEIIKKEYERLDHAEKNPTPMTIEKDPEKIKNFNKKLYGY